MSIKKKIWFQRLLIFLALIGLTLIGGYYRFLGVN
jgi:hypothetical protein